MKLSADLIISGLGTEQPCGLKTSALNRSVFAQVLRIMAYNPDFTAYINAALESHGYPTDPEMDWSAWLDTVYVRNLPRISEEMRDEAIHEMLGHHLFDPDSDVLAKFDPSRLKESIQALPLAKQLTSYLKMIFIWRIDYTIRYLQKQYPEMEVAVGLTNDEAVDRNGQYRPSLLNQLQHGVTDQVEEELIHTSEMKKLRHAFGEWCDKHLRAKSSQIIKQFFDMILVFDGTQKDLVKKFSEHVGISESRANQYLYRELPSCLRRFSATEEGKPFSLVRRINQKIEEERKAPPSPPPPAPSPAESAKPANP